MNIPIKQLRYLGALFLLSLLSACIEFEQQELTYSIVDDELTIFQEYRGIFAEERDETDKAPKKKKTGLTDSEKLEIDSAVLGERTFFFDNWISEYNRAKLIENITALEHPRKELSDDQKQDRRIWLPLYKLLLANVTVSNGDFYYDDQGRLCGYQIVRVTNLKRLVEQANRSISLLALAKQAINRNEDNPEKELIPKMKALATSGHSWIKVDGNLVTLSFPATQRQFLEAEKAAKSYVETEKPAVAISYEKSLMTINIGNNGNAPVTLSKQVFGPYTTNAVSYIASKYSIKEGLDISQIKQAAFK